MYITDDNIRLHMILDMPDGEPEKCPLVIVIHGFTGYSTERHITAAAKTMNEMGYATLRVDMYGHGESEGSFREHTLFKWLTNTMTVIDYARSLPFVTDLYLCGHSQGGLTVMLAAGMKHEFVRGIIPMSPAVMIPEMARKGNFLGTTFDPDHVPEELVTDSGLALSGNYMRAAQMIHADDAISRFSGPVLLIHADTDEAVPYQVSVEAQKAYRNARLITIPDDTHCYDNHLDMVLDAIRENFPAGW